MPDDLSMCQSYLSFLCETIRDRSVGSSGNQEATKWFQNEIRQWGWDTSTTRFDAIDWETNGVDLTVAGKSVEAFASPYSNGCDIIGELVTASTIDELKSVSMTGKILAIHGELAKEQLMPKNFVFYNPETHQEIIKTLENARPAAIICITSQNSSLAGGVYPFPLIEDGDFDIPSVFTKDTNSHHLLSNSGLTVHLASRARRVDSHGYNIVARKGDKNGQRVIITGHIDAKKGSPGAIDNATGVVTLLLIAKQLSHYDGNRLLEIVPFNGEDYFAVPGQTTYIQQNNGDFSDTITNINIDGAGYYEGATAISYYNPTDQLNKTFQRAAKKYTDIIDGPSWPQGDHSIFAQLGLPAVALTSEWFSANMEYQSITHTPKDNLSIVNSDRLIELSHFLVDAIQAL